MPPRRYLSLAICPTCPCMAHCPGRLAFIICPHCEGLFFECDEVLTVFPDPHDLQHKPWLSAFPSQDDLCPQCGMIALADFRDATLSEILAGGFALEASEQF